MGRRLTNDEFLSLATRLLDQREATPAYQHWVIDKEGVDQEESYCSVCAKQALAELIQEQGAAGEDDDEPRTIYEYPETEDDGCRHCETCGALLAYTLTNYGVAEELGYFTEPDTQWDWNSPDTCYELARIAHGIYHDKVQERTLIKVLRKGKRRPRELSAAALSAGNGAGYE